MAKGKLCAVADERQARVENAMALLGRSKALLRHDSLRVRQAVDRVGLDDLLCPVLDDHQQILCDIGRVQDLLREIWDAGQANRWST